MRRAGALAALLLAALAAVQCGAGLAAAPRSRQRLAAGWNPHPVRLRVPPARPLSAVARLGRALFFDPGLSASGRMSCASCHSPAQAYGPPGRAAVMLGGPQLRTPGFRAVPSLRYLYRQPPFTIGPDLQNGTDVPVPLARQVRRAGRHRRVLKSAGQPLAAAANRVPQGGLFWDGRADTLEQQINGPLYNPAEMDGGTPVEVAAKLRRSRYAATLVRLFGPSVFDNPRLAVAEAMFAIGRFEREDPSFHPFSSKFDAWLEGKARFTPAELRGYALFNDPRKGNCAACHLDRPGPDGLPPLFTDFQYEALGVPRNPAIPANRNPRYYDLGLCGPFRSDLHAERQYCGMFLTPSLRNVATRHVFFHNGVFHSLHQVLEWYVNRDLHPGRFYPRNARGQVVKFNDLPPADRRNVDTVDAPFNRHPGDAPALTGAEIGDVIAFLDTLTDGYRGTRRCALNGRGACAAHAAASR
jgi:cytochrome c peroxidase